MNVIYETLDGEKIIEVVLTKKDIFLIQEGMITSNLFEIENQVYNIGVRLAIKGEEDATHKIRKQGSNRKKYL